MIFVTVGMHPVGFERLVRKMDEIAGNLDEDVVMQIGGTRYAPVAARSFQYCTQEEINDFCAKSRLVVTHGAMTIVDALNRGACVVAVPRLKKYGEAIDDHQLYLVRELEKAGKIKAAYDVEDLPGVLAGERVMGQPEASDRHLATALKDYIKDLGDRKGNRGK